jgi:hypothetical protein
MTPEEAQVQAYEDMILGEGEDGIIREPIECRGCGKDITWIDELDDEEYLGLAGSTEGQFCGGSLSCLP